MPTYTEVVRRGIRMKKELSFNSGIRVYEYWALPVAGVVLHKLGQINRISDAVLMALRCMRSGTELKEFDEIVDAEDWIAQSNVWGPLEMNGIE